MKIQMLFLPLFLIPLIGLSQYEVKIEIENAVPIIEVDPLSEDLIKEHDEFKHLLLLSQAVEFKSLSASEFKETGEKMFYYYSIDTLDNKISLKKIKDEVNLKNKDFRLQIITESNSKFTFRIQASIADKIIDQGGEKTFLYCKKSDVFKTDGEPCNDYDQITQVPFPQFQDFEDELPKSRNHRYLVIDANPNPLKKSNVTLYKFRNSVPEYDKGSTFTDNFQARLKKTRSIPRNSSFSVFVAYHSLRTIKSVSIEISGLDYSFNKGISDILGLINTTENKEQQEEKKDGEEGMEAASFDKNDTKEESYLKTVEKYLYETESIQYLNINDLLAIEEYKKTLNNAIQNGNIPLNAEGIQSLSRIMEWYPKWISITPISLMVPDADEFEIKTVIAYNNGTSMKNTVANYRVSGGMAFNLGSRVYLTGLKNNKVYTEDIENGDGAMEKRARINKDHQTSVGVGLNGEIAFRTGGIVNPTLNLGFFVPFEEDISPYLAFGPGFTLTAAKVKFSFSGGVAIGSVNAVAERFIDKDVSSVTDVTTLSEKVWDSSWYLSIGLSYKL